MVTVAGPTSDRPGHRGDNDVVDRSVIEVTTIQRIAMGTPAASRLNPTARSRRRLSVVANPLGVGQDAIHRRYADPGAPSDLGALQALHI